MQKKKLISSSPQPKKGGYAERARSRSPKVDFQVLKRTSTSNTSLRGKRLIDKQEVFVNMTGVFDKYLRVYNHEDVHSPLKEVRKATPSITIEEELHPQTGQGGELMRPSGQNSHRNMVSFSDNEFTVESSLQSREASAEQLQGISQSSPDISPFHTLSEFSPNLSPVKQLDGFNQFQEGQTAQMTPSLSPLKNESRIPQLSSLHKSSPGIYLKTKTIGSIETTEKKMSPLRLEDEKAETIRLSAVNLKRLRIESEQVDEGNDLLGETESASSRVMSEQQLLSIVKLLSNARGKNAVLKKTLLLLRKHNTLLENQNKLMKERVVGAELQNQKLEQLLQNKENQLEEQRSERKVQTDHLKETLESVQEQSGQQNNQKSAKIDALLAQIEAKNKRMKDYKRETLSLKQEVSHLKGAMERLRSEVELSESMRQGMSQIINEAHKELKVFCRADDSLNFPELNLGVNPNELHILEIEEEESEESAHRCYFD